MKKLKVFIIILVLLLAGAAVWYFWLREKEKPVVLQTEKPTRGYIALSVTATGTVQPVDTVAVGTQVSGTIKSIYADFNSVVKKGQLLAELDKTLFEASVAQFQGNLAQSQSNVVFQKGNFDRQSQLYKVGAISKADYDNALYTYSAANGAVSSIRAQLASAQKNLSLASIYSPIDGTILSRNVSEGQTVAASFSTPTLFSIAKDLTKMQVRAAVDEADIGNIRDSLRSTFTVDAFPTETFNGTVQEVHLSPSVSANVVTYTTLINAPNEDKKLKPGMTASIIIYTKEVENALLIPAKALKYKPDSSLSKQYELVYFSRDKNKTGDSTRHHGDTTGQGRRRTDTSAGKNKKDSSFFSSGKKRNGSATPSSSFVWVRSGNQLIQKRIKTGINDNTKVEVLDGLSENDEVVTGIVQESSKSGKGSTQNATSPFLPQRRPQQQQRGR